MLGRGEGAGLTPGPPDAGDGAGFTCYPGELAVCPPGHGAFVPAERIGANGVEQPCVCDEDEEDGQ